MRKVHRIISKLVDYLTNGLAKYLNAVQARKIKIFARNSSFLSNGFKSRFAFFIHPRTSAIIDMGKAYKVIHFVGWILRGRARNAFEEWLRRLGLLLDPMVIKCRILGQRSTIGWIIVIPIMGEYLISKEHRRTSLTTMENGVRIAAKLGAKILGLGALTAPATRSGRDLIKIADECGIKITTGNELTAGITSYERLLTAPTILSNPGVEVISILGAIGSVGRGISETLLSLGHRVLCIDIRYALLEDFQQDMIKKGYGERLEISSDPGRVGESKFPIIVTSGVSEFLNNNLHIFKPNSIIIDDTQPRAMKRNPKDCLVIDGGVMEFTNISWGADIGLAKHLAYACLTETVLMAYEGRIEHHIGESSAIGAHREMESFWRNQHLVRLAPLRSFGKLVKAGR